MGNDRVGWADGDVGRGESSESFEAGFDIFKAQGLVYFSQ